MKIGSVTYKFLDDPTERKKKAVERQRKKQKEYRKAHKEEIKVRQNIRNEKIRKERAKGDRKKWDELTKQEPKIQQIDIRTYQNLSNNNLGQLYTDGKQWWYEIIYGNSREIYTSDKFSTRNKAVSDLRLAL